MVKKQKKTFNYFDIAAGILLALIISLGYKAIQSQIRPVVESSRTEMKRLPPKIKIKVEQAELASPSATFQVPILMYHYVEYVKDRRDATRMSLNIEPHIFEDQVKTLKDAGYTFMTAKDLANVLDGQATLPKKPVLLTFDDGHWDMDTDVLPILKKYNARATAYLITGFLGGSDFLSQPQVMDIIKSGLVEIGAHTVHHVSLKGKLQPIVRYEVQTSKKQLQDMFHIRVFSFAYPNGAFDENAATLVQEAGFATAVSTIPGESASQLNRFFLFRLRPGRRTGEALINFLGTMQKPISSIPR